MRTGIAPNAATAVGFGDRPPSLRVISFKRVVKGSLRGFCSVEWAAAGPIFKEISIHVSHGKTWCGLPAAPVIDATGRHHVIEGKKQYRPVIEWKDRDRGDRFSPAVVELVRAKHPDALDGEAGP